jgi:hypothetical protein
LNEGPEGLQSFERLRKRSFSSAPVRPANPFEVLVKQIERDLSEDNEYWQLESTRHSDSLKRGYLLELIGQVREAGETTRWLKYVLILPKKDEQIVEVRLSAPLMEKAKYQADLDLINDSLRRWING